VFIETTIGVAFAGLLFKIRQAGIKRRFLKQHRVQIRHENEAVAEAWRNRRPREKRLVIERTFRPNKFLPPTITIRQRFQRDKR